MGACNFTASYTNISINLREFTVARTYYSIQIFYSHYGSKINVNVNCCLHRESLNQAAAA
jgi:hypothetical protein